MTTEIFEQEKSIALNRLREGGVAVVVGNTERYIPDILLQDPRFHFITTEKGELNKNIKSISIPANSKVVIITRFVGHELAKHIRREADKKGLHVFFWPQLGRLRELQVPPIVREVRNDIVTISNDGRLPPDKEPENIEEILNKIPDASFELPPPSETMAYIPVSEAIKPIEKDNNTMTSNKNGMSLLAYLRTIKSEFREDASNIEIAKYLMPKIKQAWGAAKLASVSVYVGKIRNEEVGGHIPSAKVGRPKKLKQSNEPAPSIQHVVSVPNSNNENSLLEAIDEAIIHLQLVKERIEKEFSPEAMKKKVREHLLKMMD